MRTEQEVRDRLAFWQGMLLASQVGVAVNHPEFLLRLPQNLQAYALELLKLSPELRQHVARIQEKNIGVIVDTLKWVLEEN
jgi:hypothetical protein